MIDEEVSSPNSEGKTGVFKLWEYFVDIEATRNANAKMDKGSAADCGCGDCLNWIKHRESVIPQEVLNWFEQIGIYPTKEAEVSEYEGGPETNLYIGEYLFVGEVVSGPDPYVPRGW